MTKMTKICPKCGKEKSMRSKMCKDCRREVGNNPVVCWSCGIEIGISKAEEAIINKLSGEKKQIYLCPACNEFISNQETPKRNRLVWGKRNKTNLKGL